MSKVCKNCNGTGKILDRIIPFGIGSMGMGLPASLGFALSKKMKGEKGKIYCLMSDGEMNCGTTWESALIAVHHRLRSLTVIVDCNGLQAMGKIKDILNIESLANKWRSFGWHVDETDGHDFSLLEKSLFFSEEVNQPRIILAKTIKGKGWKRAENNNLYHYKQLSKEEYKEALNELK